MKNILIIGAGQMGRAAAELLDPNRTHVLAFGDNDPGKWTQEEPAGARQQPEEIPICSVNTGLDLQPEEVLISVLGEDRTQTLAQQVREAGFSGEIRYLRDSYEYFDIRSRCIGLLADRIRRLQIPGAIAELGVYRGDTAWQLNARFPDRPLFLFDTFQGFDGRDVAQEQTEADTGRISPHAEAGRFADTSVEAVMSRMRHPEMVRLFEGYFPETIAMITADHWEHGMDRTGREHGSGGTEWHYGTDDTCRGHRTDDTEWGYDTDDTCRGHRTDDVGREPVFALVSLDPDLYAPTLEGLRYFYPRMSPGGMILVHDFNNLQFEGVRRAVEEFEAEIMNRGEQPLHMVPLADLHGSCVIVR